MGRGERISVDEGLRLIRDHIGVLESEMVDVGQALGRVTAAPIIARRTVPSFRAAAMDGYAVRSADVAHAREDAPVELTVTHRAPAGTRASAVGSGGACGIGTGAPVPDGADAVIMYENVIAATGKIVIVAPAKPGLNIREVGEDASAGNAVGGAGLSITPDVMAALSAYDVRQVELVRRPRLALFVTGSEIESENTPNSSATILDSNGPMIRAQAACLGLPFHDFGTVADDPTALDAALDRAVSSDADLIISTGGASHGEKDYVRDALIRRGARIIFHGLSMRPGKPILFALLADGRPFFGLPGNPVSACIGMRFFVSQALRAMQGLAEERGLITSCHEAGRDGTTLFLRGRLSTSHSEGLRVETDFDQRSHILSSLIAATWWIRLDRAGDEVTCRAFPKAMTFDPR